MSETADQMLDVESRENVVSSYSLKKGFFIDERLLKEAELGRDIQVKVYKGKIVIVPKNKRRTSADKKNRKQAIDEFMAFARNAPVGKLENPSERHDEYLYGKE